MIKINMNYQKKKSLYINNQLIKENNKNYDNWFLF